MKLRLSEFKDLPVTGIRAPCRALREVRNPATGLGAMICGPPALN